MTKHPFLAADGRQPTIIFKRMKATKNLCRSRSELVVAADENVT